MSDEAVRRRVRGAIEPDAADEKPCPFLCLGISDGKCVYMSRNGEIQFLGPRDHTAAGMLMLNGGDASFFVENFAIKKKKSLPGEFHVHGAMASLMRRCSKSGLFNPETPIRGPGVWRTDETIIVHCGDVLLVAKGGKARTIAAGCHHRGAIYPAAPVLQRPLRDPSTSADGRRLFDLIRRWNFVDQRAQKFVLGFIVLAMLGAAPDWRVHILVTGEKGCGKSALLLFIAAALGPQARSVNDITEAGLRQLLSGEARAVLIDEAEGDAANDVTVSMVRALRRMSGGEGLRATRGTAGGAAQSFTVAASACIAAINPPDLQPQDRSRIMVIDLLRPSSEVGAADEMRQAVDEAVKLSPALRARALEGWNRFCGNLAVYRAELLRAGCDQRLADKFATLLAAGEMLGNDEIIDTDSAGDEIAALSDMLRMARVEDDEDSDAAQCFAALMTRQIEHWRGGSKSTIGRLVQDALDAQAWETRAALLTYGVKLLRDKDARPMLFVANRHSTLSTIFRDTRWRNGAWRTALLRLSGAAIVQNPVRFDGHLARCIAIPERHLPPPEPAGGKHDEP